MSFCLVTRNGLGDSPLIIHGTVHPNLGEPIDHLFGWLVSVCIIRNSRFYGDNTRASVTMFCMNLHDFLANNDGWEMLGVDALHFGTGGWHENDDKQSKCWDRPEGFMAWFVGESLDYCIINVLVSTLKKYPVHHLYFRYANSSMSSPSLLIASNLCLCQFVFIGILLSSFFVC